MIFYRWASHKVDRKTSESAHPHSNFSVVKRFWFAPSFSNRKTQNGATVVEVALVFPLLIGIVLTIMEVSSMAAARSTVSAATSAASRIGAIAANDPDADLEVLRSLRSALGDHAKQTRYVIVFNALGFSNNNPSEACHTEAESGGTGIAGECNVYQGSALLNPIEENFGYSGVGSLALADRSWPALTRRTTYLGGRDNVGVYLSCDLPTLTGLFSLNPFRVSSVVRLEARDV